MLNGMPLTEVAFVPPTWRSMRIAVVDYGNYGFIRQAVKRIEPCMGLDPFYMFSGSVLSPSSRTPCEDVSLDGRQIAIRTVGEFRKDSLVRRRFGEAAWGRSCCDVLTAIAPGLVMSANAPLEVQVRIAKWCQHNNVRFVFWLQDIFALGIRGVLRRKLPVVGLSIAAYYAKLERSLLRASDHVLVIADDHRKYVESEGVTPDRITVLPNWATLDQLPLHCKDNSWSRIYRLHESFNFVYSGTLALKHNPSILLSLARHFRTEASVRVVVVSEGPGAGLLREAAEREQLSNLVVLPFQPQQDLPLVLGCADVLLSVLDRAVSTCCVPSKVLTYLCAGRAQLMAVPLNNPAARLVSEERAGFAAEPEEIRTFIMAAEKLYRDDALRTTMGNNGRAYAEREFDSVRVSERLGSFLQRVSADNEMWFARC